MSTPPDVTVMPDVVLQRPRAGVAVVCLRGEHDTRTAKEISELFSSLLAENDLVVVDLSDAQFIDSSLLHTLMKANRDSGAYQSRFRIQMGTAPIVERALEVSGVLSLLDWVTDRNEALAT
jgi:anti-anti-sigma factor